MRTVKLTKESTKDILENLRISLFNFCICDADSLFCHISFVKFFCIGKKGCVPFIFYFIKDLSMKMEIERIRKLIEDLRRVLQEEM